MLYSKTTNGFYSTDVHAADQIPGDAVEISDADYRALLDGLSAGKFLCADESGKPFLTSTRSLSDYEKLAALQQEAHGALLASDLTVLRCYERGIKVPDALVTYRTELRSIVSAKAIPAQASLPAVPDFPEGS